MIESISGISNMKNFMGTNSITSTKNNTTANKIAGNDNESGFNSILDETLKELEAAELNVAKDSTQMLTGESVDLHTSMINLEKADIALRLTMQVRNKVIDAYKEVMRMQF